METVLCDISAFRLHRTPPQVTAVLPSLAGVAASKSRLAFANHPTTEQLLGLPVHRLLFDSSQRCGGRDRNFKDHLWTAKNCGIAIEEHPIGCGVTSPLYTLLFLARHVPLEQLIMAMYEMCGMFAVFHPSAAIEAELSKLNDKQALDAYPNWERVINLNGAPTDLWKRAPLIDLADLHDFAQKTEGLTGHKAFVKAARYVTGITASPFEVQASMLLGLPRHLGGEGFEGLENNKRISLSPNARNLALQSTCFADLYFEAYDGAAPLDIECHGRGVHDGERASISDADRATALESMGINVVQLTYGQIQDPARFESVRQLIAKLRGTRITEKCPAFKQKEMELRRQLFIDWNTLCA